MQASLPWRPIEGLADPAALAAAEVRAFTGPWQRRRDQRREAEALDTFQERLARQRHVEAGVRGSWVQFL